MTRWATVIAGVLLTGSCSSSHTPVTDAAPADGGTADGAQPDTELFRLGCDDPRCKTLCCDDARGEYCCDYNHGVDGEPMCGDEPPCMNGEWCCPDPARERVCGSFREYEAYCLYP